MTLALFVVRRQRVPVGDEEEALVVVLQADPVLQRAVVVAEVHRAGRAHAGEDAAARGRRLACAHGRRGSPGAEVGSLIDGKPAKAARL